MATFSYGGLQHEIDWLISFARVSSSQQSEDQGGDGLSRQRLLFEKFSEQVGVKTDVRYHVGSGSKGKHIQPKAALGAIVADIQSGSIKPKTGLVVESFSRLSRLHIDDALNLFLEIIRGGVTLFTLQDASAYNRKSLRGNAGDIHKVAALLQAARVQADSTGFYSKHIWAKRRGTSKSIVPAWINRDADLTVDEAKAATVRRIFTMALTMGSGQIAQTLNKENVPATSNRARQRSVVLWDKGTIAKLLRGRQVLGEQEIGEYRDGKRTLTGRSVKAYPPIIDEALWLAVRDRMSKRKHGGIEAGRNVQSFANIFGDLARCECGSRMKVFTRGRANNYRYLGCSAAFVGGCSHKRFYRLDQTEFYLHTQMGKTYRAMSQTGDDLKPQIERLKTEVDRLQRRYQVAFDAFADSADVLARDNLERVRNDHRMAVQRLQGLEAQLAQASVQPAVQPSELAAEWALLEGLSDDQKREIRQKIAARLPTIIRRIVFLANGTQVTELQPGWVLSLDGQLVHSR